MRGAILALLLLFAAEANAREARLPIPPIPPKGPLPLEAPVPNRSIFDQYTAVPRSTVTLDTGINHREAPSQGMGYPPGAHYQIDNDRRWLVVPGIMLHVPLP